MTAGALLPPNAPTSTYRLQLNREFTFRDATSIVPYLDRLGVDWLYASPYLQARPGSMHGYDISNHNELNPEIGSEAEHAALVRALRDREMGHILDIVPNHMGIGQPDNGWWMDVLENGPSSTHAPYFDIDWHPLKPELAGKVLLPVLGDQFGRILESGELKLRYTGERFRVEYHEHIFPVSPRSMSLILRRALERLDGRADEETTTELESIVTALEHLPQRSRTDADSVSERNRESVVSRRRIATLYEGSDDFRRALDGTIEQFNGRPGDPTSFDDLELLLDDQAYRLAYWRVAAEEINYRRFFDVNELAGIRVERGEVFQATHRLIFRLLEEGKLDGLRIDHPDGLYDPRGYLRQLQREASRRVERPPLYVVVEKILTREEPLPSDWPVAGTVGYEFLNRLNGLFVEPGSEAEMTAAYRAFIGRDIGYQETIYEKKRLILRVALVSELNVLAFLLDRTSESNRRVRDFTLGSLREALREVIACFPVYRTYIDAHTGEVSDRDRAYVLRAVRTAIRLNPALSRSIFEFIRSMLLLEWPEELDGEAREEHARFVMKFQQLTGPVMAKGVEDTAFYVYNRLVSLNEVGGEPSRFGVTPEEFHGWIEERRRSWPQALNATSTHDTKRSEDVRVRIDALSELPGEWNEAAREWARVNEAERVASEDGPMPARNDEYLLYQTLVGAWPLDELDGPAREAFIERIQRYMQKATHEAKVHTSWISPDEEYDAAMSDFVAAVLRHTEFLDRFLPFQRRVARLGMLSALSQTLLKLTLPGVPDVYQGQELWDLSLVDPDNRRPVDYERRARLLEEIAGRGAGERGASARSLMERWEDGGPKLLVTHAALSARRRSRALFREGEYRPLECVGPRARHVVAFARLHGEDLAVVVAPRLFAPLTRGGELAAPDPEAWGDTAVLLPPETAVRRLRDELFGRTYAAEGTERGASLPLRSLLAEFPVALLAPVGVA